MEVRQRRERGCGLFLSCENQIFLKLPRQWLAEKAATAMTGRGHSRLHTQFNPSQSAWHHINQAFISMDPKNYISIHLLLTGPKPGPCWPIAWTRRPPTRQDHVAPPTALTHRHIVDIPTHVHTRKFLVWTAQTSLHISATFQQVWNNRVLFLKYKMKQDGFFRS